MIFMVNKITEKTANKFIKLDVTLFYENNTILVFFDHIYKIHIIYIIFRLVYQNVKTTIVKLYNNHHHLRINKYRIGQKNIIKIRTSFSSQ